MTTLQSVIEQLLMKASDPSIVGPESHLKDVSSSVTLSLCCHNFVSNPIHTFHPFRSEKPAVDQHHLLFVFVKCSFFFHCS